MDSVEPCRTGAQGARGALVGTVGGEVAVLSQWSGGGAVAVSWFHGFMGVLPARVDRAAEVVGVEAQRGPGPGRWSWRHGSESLGREVLGGI